MHFKSFQIQCWNKRRSSKIAHLAGHYLTKIYHLSKSMHHSSQNLTPKNIASILKNIQHSNNRLWQHMYIVWTHKQSNLWLIQNYNATFKNKHNSFLVLYVGSYCFWSRWWWQIKWSLFIHTSTSKQLESIWLETTPLHS